MIDLIVDNKDAIIGFIAIASFHVHLIYKALFAKAG